MLLVIDVGNSDTKLGFYPLASAGRLGPLARTWRVTTQRRRSSDEFGVLFVSLFTQAQIALSDVKAIVISSVVPQNDRALNLGCKEYFHCEPQFFSAAKQRLIEIRTDRPTEVGADLVAAAIGAIEGYGAPAVVIGFGTATTFGAVSQDGAYIGAAIAPGIQISIDALVERTAKLPQVALHAPKSAIGRETVSSLQSGIVFGVVGQVEGLVARIRAEIGAHARVIATGGLADGVAKQTPMIHAVDPHLTFTGLRLFYESMQ